MRRGHQGPQAGGRLRRLSRTGLIAVACLSFGSFAVAPVVATVDQQEQEVRRVVAELEKMHERIDQFVEQHVQALERKAELDAQIGDSQVRVAEQELELQQIIGQLGDVAVQKFVDGDNSALGPLFTDPTDLGDGLQRDHLTRVALNAGSATTDDYEGLLKGLNEERQRLQQAQTDVVAVAEAAEQHRLQAEAAKVELEQRLLQEKSRLGDLIEQEEQRQIAAAQAEYEQQVQARQAQLAAAAASVSSSSGNGGGNSTSSGSSSAVGTSSSGSSSSGSGAAAAAVAPQPQAQAPVAQAVNNPPPVSGGAGVAVNAAMAQIGTPYRYATSSPGVAFDCSGLTMYAWGAAGVGLPHQSARQFASVPHVDKTDAQPGDLIFYYSPISHVGIYLGGGQLVHAPATGDRVKVSAVNWSKVVGVGRPG